MIITFQGLIAHHKLDVGGGVKQQIAVLIAATAHRASLGYRKEDIYKSTSKGWQCEPPLKKGSLRGCITTSLGNGLPTREVIGSVPKLSDTTDGTKYSAEIANCPPDPKSPYIAAVFYLPPDGALEEGHFFLDEVNFGAYVHGPLPQTVTYTCAATTPVTITIDDGTTKKKLSFYRDAHLHLMNVCKAPGDHYQFYQNVFEEPAKVVVQNPKANGKTCGFPSSTGLLKCSGASTLAIDCVNSAFP